MPVHIFQVDETNFEICRERGVAGIFEGKTKQVDDVLISRLMLMHIGDPVLFYVGKSKHANEKSRQELHGVWRIASEPFYDTSQVWEDRVYPYRVCIEEMDGALFEVPIKLSDIYHLRDSGHVWTFSLMRNWRTVNSVFSMTNQEYDAIFDEFVKVNPIGCQAHYLYNPISPSNSLLFNRIHYNKKTEPEYESSLMALLARGLVEGDYAAIFKKFTDCIIYVPTNWGKEIDMLLLHGHPNKCNIVSSYDLIEVKRDTFDETGLEQLLNYESWFIEKRVLGEANMVRSIAIAHSFHKNVKEYLKLRAKYEKKQVALLTYKLNDEKKIELTPVEY